MTKEDREELSKLTKAVNNSVKANAVKFSRIEQGQKDLGDSFSFLRKELQTTREDQLSCPARNGWEDFKGEVRSDIDRLDDDTKKINTSAAYRNGKTQRSTAPEKREDSQLLKQVKEKFGIALIMASIAGLTLLTQMCTSSEDEIKASINSTRARVEHVDQKAEIAGAVADALKDRMDSDSTRGE